VIAAGSADIGMAQAALPGMFEYPQHKVTLADEFAISTHEVTVGQFREFAEESGIDWQGCRAADSPGIDPSTLSWRAPGFAQS
ncbi:hypothetical protein DF186_21185, partial [Enterococcus hirae]